MTGSTPRGLTTPVRDDWAVLGRSAPSTSERPALDDYPEPVQRWLDSALGPGSGGAGAVEVRMHGEIRLGRWARFTARQRLSLDGGFVWAATARVAGLPVIGFDRFTRETGEMRWRLLDVVPVLSADGPDVSRSAAGRHAGEALLLAPASALDPRVRWTPLDGSRATASLPVGAWTHEVTVSVDPAGCLTSLVVKRWGNPDGQAYREETFGAELTEPRRFDGQTVPTMITAGWFPGSDRWPTGQFIRYRIDAVDPLPAR